MICRKALPPGRPAYCSHRCTQRAYEERNRTTTRGQLALFGLHGLALRPGAQVPKPIPTLSGVNRQICLFPRPARDFTRFSRQADHEPDNPILVLALRHAARISEDRGWPARGTYKSVRLGLAIVLAGHTKEDLVLYSELRTLRSGISHIRLAEVLAELGLLHDDRPAATEQWIERVSSEMPEGFRDDVKDWLTWLHKGDSRTRPRTTKTVYAYFGQVKPFLTEWDKTRQRLREITRADVEAALELHQRHHTTLTAVKSLFRFARKYKRIFTDPAARIYAGSHTADPKNILPIDQHAIDIAAKAADTPALRLIVALAAIHAARPAAIRHLKLDDIDLPNRRITINGLERPLDNLTRQALQDYLHERRARWPLTNNPHVLITRTTAWETNPVSLYYLSSHHLVAHLGTTLDAIRADRVLDEALQHGADPFRLTTLFGLHTSTAIRYSAAALRLIDEPEDQQRPAEPNHP